MSNVTLFDYQKNVLDETADFNKVAYYLDMGLGKTFVGSEKLHAIKNRVNLVICQKSKIKDWIDHFTLFYGYDAYDLTNKKELDYFLQMVNSDEFCKDIKIVGVINYELVWRRKVLLNLNEYTSILDESSMISNPTAKRSKFIDKMHPENIILLSGTPTGGKYEKIWSQLKLLGWGISKKTFYQHYVEQEWIDDGSGFKKAIIVGYKNVDRLKAKLKQYGCVFLKTDEVLELPDMVDIPIHVESTTEYKRFRKKDFVVLPDGSELIGDTRLTRKLYSRQLCGQYNQHKLEAFKDLVSSTDDRLIVFYNFDKELDLMKEAIKDFEKPISIVNGKVKDLSAYDNYSDSITFIQYQAGAMGLNLQKANKMVFYTLPESSIYFEQAKKRINRVGQERTCFYYYLLCSNTIEPDMLKVLKMRKDYDDALFDQAS